MFYIIIAVGLIVMVALMVYRVRRVASKLGCR